MKYKIFSAGKPSFSYIAKKKNGSIAPTMISAAPCVPNTPFVRKYKGTPTSAAPEKQMICLFVRFNATFVLIPLRSFGTATDIAINTAPFVGNARQAQIFPA